MESTMKYATILGFVIWAMASTANAAAVELPASLTGQWCQTTMTGDPGEGDYVKAKNYCRSDRPVVFHIHKQGFWVKLADVRPMVMCVPRKVEPFAHGWLVVADCSAD